MARWLFRPTLEGAQQLRRDGPFLLVANHSAALGIAEIFCFAVMYAREIGVERPLAGFAHKIAFKIWPLSVFLNAFGAVPSTYDAAGSTLAAGVPLLVFPGGDHETLRPIWQANRVDFGGRKGFLRVAIQAGVPIVPMGIRGSHYTAPVLLRARWLAWFFVGPRLLGLKRWGVTALGLVGAVGIAALPLSWPAKAALIWLWLGSPLSFVPVVPWTVRFRVGEPLTVGDDEDLEVALARVQRAIQALVTG